MHISDGLMKKIRAAIRENIASHEDDDNFFGNTSLGFKRFEVLYWVGFAPKCSEKMWTLIVAVKHKVVHGDNVTVFEVKQYSDGKMVAMFDGNANIDFENKKVSLSIRALIEPAAEEAEVEEAPAEDAE